MKNILILILTVSLQLPSFASNVSQSSNEQTTKVFDLIQNADLVVADYLRLLAFVGTREEMSAITASLKKQNVFPSMKIPKVKITDTQISIAGLKEPLKIVSTKPWSLSYRGNIWTYDTTISLDKNYLALQSILQSRSVSAFAFMVPSANADEYWLGAVAGAATGLAVTGLVCLGTGVALAASPVLLPAVTIGAILGAIGGVYYGDLKDEKIRAAAQDKSVEGMWRGELEGIMATDYQVMCNNNQVIIRGHRPKDPPKGALGWISRPEGTQTTTESYKSVTTRDLTVNRVESKDGDTVNSKAQNGDTPVITQKVSDHSKVEIKQEGKKKIELEAFAIEWNRKTDKISAATSYGSASSESHRVSQKQQDMIRGYFGSCTPELAAELNKKFREEKVALQDAINRSVSDVDVKKTPAITR